VLQGGSELCRIEGFDRGKTVSELKVSIEAEVGLVPALTRLINPESHVELQNRLTLEDAGMLSKHALAEGAIQLYAQTLKKIVVADELQIAPGQVTDSELAVLCGSIKDDPPDILVLCGCRRVTNISYLMQLSTISHLDISSCDLGAKGGFHLAGVIKDMGSLTSLNLASNGLGEMVLPEGWQQTGMTEWTHTNGSKAMADPRKPDGIIALANVIPGMGALSVLSLKKNSLGTKAAGKALGEMLKVNSVLKQLDLSDNGVASYERGGAPGFAQELALGIKDNRAISSIDLLKNYIPIEQAQELVQIMQAKEKLVTLCGLSKEETELDFSGQDLGAGDAVLIANGISDMGALTSLNLASNSIGGHTDDYDYKFIATPEGISSHTQSYCAYPTRTSFSYCYRC
jgi:hypothetical protein